MSDYTTQFTFNAPVYANQLMIGNNLIQIDDEWVPSIEFQQYYRGWVRVDMDGDEEEGEVHTQVELSQWEDYLYDHRSEILRNRDDVIMKLLNRTGIWNHDHILVLKRFLKENPE